ncbi:MAG: efflux RND transporter periplasmic adaptor subunit [Oscillospiraceae bacterium]|nr:efflux RND transporter periplasmic adaptor subunit [Oscillospiraceae bacterium]
MSNNSKKKNNKIKILALTIAVAIIAGTIFVAATADNGEPTVGEVEEVNRAVSVETMTSHVGDIVVVSEYIGVVEPNHEVIVYPKVSGEIVSINFSVGDMVEAGDVLFEIDSEAVRSALAQTRAAVTSAQAKAEQNLAIAETNLDSFVYNIEHGHDINVKSASSSIDNAQAALDAAMLTKNNADVGVEAAVIASSNAQIAQENAIISGSNANIALDGALISEKNADIAAENAQTTLNNAKETANIMVENALKAQDNAEKILENAQMALQMATIDLRSTQVQWDNLLAFGAPVGASFGQLQDSLTNALKLAEFNVQAAERGIEQAQNGLEAAKLGVEQARISASLSDAGVKTAQNAVEAAELGIEQAKNAAALSELGERQAQNASAQSELNIEQAKIAVQSSELGIENAKNNLDKAKDGYDTAVIMTNQQRVSIEAQVEMARLNTNFEDQQIAIQKLADDLEKFSVSSPIRGLVEARNIELFNMVSPQVAAFTISDKDSMTVAFKIPKSAYTHTVLGDKVTVHSDGVDSEGVITEIATKVDSNGLFVIKATVSNPPAGLYNGATVRVFANAQRALNTTVVPLSVIKYDNGVPFLFIAEGNVAKKVLVETGIFDRENIQILSGIEPTDKIIKTWSARLEDGVEIIDS